MHASSLSGKAGCFHLVCSWAIADEVLYDRRIAALPEREISTELPEWARERGPRE